MGYRSYSGPLLGPFWEYVATEPGLHHPPVAEVALLCLPESTTACQESLDLSASPQTGRRLQIQLLLAQPEVTSRMVPLSGLDLRLLLSASPVPSPAAVVADRALYVARPSERVLTLVPHILHPASSRLGNPQ